MPKYGNIIPFHHFRITAPHGNFSIVIILNVVCLGPFLYKTMSNTMGFLVLISPWCVIKRVPVVFTILFRRIKTLFPLMLHPPCVTKRTTYWHLPIPILSHTVLSCGYKWSLLTTNKRSKCYLYCSPARALKMLWMHDSFLFDRLLVYFHLDSQGRDFDSNC